MNLNSAGVKIERIYVQKLKKTERRIIDIDNLWFSNPLKLNVFLERATAEVQTERTTVSHETVRMTNNRHTLTSGGTIAIARRQRQDKSCATFSVENTLLNWNKYISTVTNAVQHCDKYIS